MITVATVPAAEMVTFAVKWMWDNGFKPIPYWSATCIFLAKCAVIPIFCMIALDALTYFAKHGIDSIARVSRYIRSGIVGLLTACMASHLDVALARAQSVSSRPTRFVPRIRAARHRKLTITVRRSKRILVHRRTDSNTPSDTSLSGGDSIVSTSSDISQISSPDLPFFDQPHRAREGSADSSSSNSSAADTPFLPTPSTPCDVTAGRTISIEGVDLHSYFDRLHASSSPSRWSIQYPNLDEVDGEGAVSPLDKVTSATVIRDCPSPSPSVITAIHTPSSRLQFLPLLPSPIPCAPALAPAPTNMADCDDDIIPLFLPAPVTTTSFSQQHHPTQFDIMFARVAAELRSSCSSSSDSDPGEGHTASSTSTLPQSVRDATKRWRRMPSEMESEEREKDRKSRIAVEVANTRKAATKREEGHQTRVRRGSVAAAQGSVRRESRSGTRDTAQAAVKGEEQRVDKVLRRLGSVSNWFAGGDLGTTMRRKEYV